MKNKPEIFYLQSAGSMETFTEAEIRELISFLKEQAPTLTDTDKFEEWRSCMLLIDKFVSVLKEY